MASIGWKTFIGIAFLSLQLVSIIYARFDTNRYFAWAPHDIQTEYYLEVEVKAKKLSDHQLKERYAIMGEHGWVDLPPDHVIDWFLQYERTCEPHNQAEQIVFTYRVNGKEWQTWRWPL